MIYGSLTMEPSFSGTNEHRWVPLGMSIFVAILSALMLARQMTQQEADIVIDAQSFFVLIIPCILLLAAYAQGTILFSYVPATYVSGVLVFRLFRNSWLTCLIQSAIATLVLYFIFFNLLRLYNPPGRWLDVQMPF